MQKENYQQHIFQSANVGYRTASYLACMWLFSSCYTISHRPDSDDPPIWEKLHLTESSHRRVIAEGYRLGFLTSVESPFRKTSYVLIRKLPEQTREEAIELALEDSEDLPDWVIRALQKGVPSLIERNVMKQQGAA